MTDINKLKKEIQFAEAAVTRWQQTSEGTAQRLLVAKGRFEEAQDAHNVAQANMQQAAQHAAALKQQLMDAEAAAQDETGDDETPTEH